MSSAPTLQEYFCYQCNRTVSLTPTPDPLCPICNSGFLEEYTPQTNPNPNPILFDPFSALFGSNTGPNQIPSDFFATHPNSINAGNSNMLPFFGNPNATGLNIVNPNPNQTAAEEFNPLSFLQTYLNTLRAGGAEVQLVIENSDGRNVRTGANLTNLGQLFGARGGGGVNLGDYFVGPGLEQLIQQLAENDPNRYGTPPASKTAIENLPDIEIDEDVMKSDYSQCAVCMDSFEIGGIGKQMPCKHMYHKDCILPWLELHNSCPVCRFELPTDDAEYENRAREGGNGGAVSVVEGGGNGNREDVETPRSFRVTLPWPFRRFGGEGSGGAGGGGSGSGGPTQPSVD